MITIHDQIQAELDRRRLQEVVDSGAITQEELDNAPIISKSECCAADLESPDLDGEHLYCSKCKQPCEGVEE